MTKKKNTTHKEIQLSLKQIVAMEALKQPNITEVMYGGSAGGGKTRLGVLWLITMCSMYPGTRWVMGRAVLQRLKETTLKSFFDVSRELGMSVPAGKYWHYNQQNNTITWYNGSEIILKDLSKQPSDPEFDSLGSLEITGAFIDEVAEVDEKAKAVLMSRIRYKLDEYGLTPKALFTTNPCKSWPYTQFYKPAEAGKLEPHRRFIAALPGDNPWLPQSYIDGFNNQPKSIRDRLLLGKWEVEADDLQMMAFDDILHAFENRSVAVLHGGDVVGTTNSRGDSDTEGYITVDPARLGKDSTCVILWKGMAVTEIHRIQYPKDCIDASAQTVTFVRDLAAKHAVQAKNIIVDSVGVGGGPADYLRGCRHFVGNARAIHGENYAHCNAQMYFALAEAVTAREIYIDCDSESRKLAIEELEQVRRRDKTDLHKFDVCGKDAVKKVLGRSPDIADALMMRMLPIVEKRKKAQTYDSVVVLSW